MNDQESTKDPSPLELLLRYAQTPQEQRVVLNILRQWALHDPDSFPAQMSVITLAQWQAAASVPLEVERLLSQYHQVFADANGSLDQILAYFQERIDYIRTEFEDAAIKMEVQTSKNCQMLEESEQHLKRLIYSFESMLHHARQQLNEEMEQRTTRIWCWAICCSLFLAGALSIVVLWYTHDSEPAHADNISDQQVSIAPTQ